MYIYITYAKAGLNITHQCSEILGYGTSWHACNYHGIVDGTTKIVFVLIYTNYYFNMGYSYKSVPWNFRLWYNMTDTCILMIAPAMASNQRIIYPIRSRSGGRYLISCNFSLSFAQSSLFHLSHRSLPFSLSLLPVSYASSHCYGCRCLFLGNQC